MSALNVDIVEIRVMSVVTDPVNTFGCYQSSDLLLTQIFYLIKRDISRFCVFIENASRRWTVGPNLIPEYIFIS